MQILGIVVGLLVLVFFVTLLGVLFGAFAGWLVGVFFDETCVSFLKMFGLSEFAMWQIGSLLGFVGSFFKSVQTNSNS